MEIETNNPTLEISSTENEVGIETPKTVVNKNHAIMKNLDYENSGHTGFASFKDIEDINNKLSDLEHLKNMSGNASDISYEDNTGQGLDNVQDGLDEAFNQIENINNNLNNIDGKKIPYNDDYGYGAPDNMYDALDFAFEELDNRATHDVLGNYVAYNYKQNKTETEKDRARENIGISNTCVFHHKSQNLSEVRKRIARNNIGVRGVIFLGEIDLDEYQGDMSRFLDTLTENGSYEFYDTLDNFYWHVEVYKLDNGSMGQEYWNTEEGYLSKYYREGYYDEDSDTFVLYNETQYLNSSSASNMFAPKSHAHFSNISTAKDIRAYLDSYLNYTVKDLRVTCTTNKHVYMVRVDYVNYTLNGTTRNVRYQEYYDIEEPNKKYKRSGLSSNSAFSSAITWGNWYVFEGVAE